jgi:23S rRNA G2069 N7-methylase RlmK/C1962 C5-methylase RlmI
VLGTQEKAPLRGGAKKTLPIDFDVLISTSGSLTRRLAAARAGAANVIAIDINPNATESALENARANGLGTRVTAVASDLLSALTPHPIFDVIVSSPPSFAGEPRDIADRAWHAGPNYRDVASLFQEARERLASGGRMYVLLSTDYDLELLGDLISQADFRPGSSLSAQSSSRHF